MQSKCGPKSDIGGCRSSIFCHFNPGGQSPQTLQDPPGKCFKSCWGVFTRKRQFLETWLPADQLTPTGSRTVEDRTSTCESVLKIAAGKYLLFRLVVKNIYSFPKICLPGFNYSGISLEFVVACIMIKDQVLIFFLCNRLLVRITLRIQLDNIYGNRARSTQC